MGEDQLQRLFKIGPSESLLFQLEMEKKNPYFVVESYSTQKEWGYLVVMCLEQTSLFRMCLRCLGKCEEHWSPQRAFKCQSVSWMFLTLINLPCQAQKCLRWAVIATNGQKSTATFCAWGLFHFLGFQTSCFHMTLPVSIHILQIRFPPFCFTAWKEICSRFFP